MNPTDKQIETLVMEYIDKYSEYLEMGDSGNFMIHKLAYDLLVSKFQVEYYKKLTEDFRHAKNTTRTG